MNVDLGLLTFGSYAEFSNLGILQGLTPLGVDAPETAHKSAAITAAMRHTYPGTDYLVRPLRKQGYVVAKEIKGDATNEWHNVVTASFNGDGFLHLFCHNGDDRRRQVREAYNRYSGMVTAGQLSGVVSRAAQKLGISLRESGGIYFLPACHDELWSQVAGVIEAAAVEGRSRVYIVRHNKDESTLRLVRDAIAADIERETAEIESEINSGKLGARALEGRTKQADALRQRVAEYEGILGESLKPLSEIVEKLEVGIGLACIMRAAADAAIA